MIVGLFGGFGTLDRSRGPHRFLRLRRRSLHLSRSQASRDYREVFVECATIVGGILLILGVALGFTNYLVDAEVPRA